MRLAGRRTLLIGLAICGCAALLAALYFSSQPQKLTGREAEAAGRDLAEATRTADTATARALIEQGADVNATSADGTSVLHWAVHLGDDETARLLIRHGARVDPVNRYGLAPLHVAAAEGRPKLVQLLLEAGASTNLRDRKSTRLNSSHSQISYAVFCLK